MNILILIDHEFPYKTDEAFLENEIGELSKAFDRVLIFPILVTKGERQTRPIPAENVTVFPVKKGENRYLKALRRKFRFAGLRLLSAEKKKAVERMDYIRGYEKYALKTAGRILPVLDGCGFTEGDHIVLYSYWFFFPARIVVELKKYFQERKIGVSAVSRAHGFDVYEERNRFHCFPQRELQLEEFDRVFVCSQNGAAYMKDKYPAYSSKIEAAHLGTCDHGTGSFCRKPFRIVSCSRVVELKRVDVIAKAVLALIEKGCDVEWIHLGDGPEMSKVREIVKDNRRIVLKGHLPNAQVLDFYQNTAVDLFINASTSEGLPVSIMEATSFGIPVLATDAGGTSEIVKNNITGFLLPKDLTIDSLSAQIEQIIHMPPEEYAALRTSTRRFWETGFNAEENYKKFIAEIRQI